MVRQTIKLSSILLWSNSDVHGHIASIPGEGVLMPSAVAALRSRQIMYNNLRSLLESRRCGRHIAGRRLVVSPSIHYFRYEFTTIAREMPAKFAVSDIDVSSRQVITISSLPNFDKSAAFIITSIITLLFVIQCIGSLYTPTSAAHVPWFCF